jgi:hypothetical protein
MESKKTGYLILTILGLLVIVFTGSQAWQTLRFRSIAVQTDGTIVGERVSVGGKRHYQGSFKNLVFETR